MKLTIGFSPCPNDTFIFDALINGKIDTGSLIFEPVLEDVETLNKWAIGGRLDITKLSYGVLPLVLMQYQLLNSGSALGTGVGPLLISNREPGIVNVERNTIAIPGEHTTAHLLFSMAYPRALKKVFMRYDEIENFVQEDKGMGVIIHENRFTYMQKGLSKIIDLGDYWEKETGSPIPLGGIAVKRNFEKNIQKQIEELIKKSIAYAYTHYPVLSNYVKIHAKEMSEEVMRRHIDLYVNDFSTDIGEEGKMAINKMAELFNISHSKISPEDIFV